MTLAAALVLSAAVWAAPVKLELAPAPLSPSAVFAQTGRLSAIESADWPAAAAAVLFSARTPQAQAAASLVAEALARPELLPALAGGSVLAPVVQALHADAASRARLLELIQPLRREDWASYFDGARQAAGAPDVAAEANFPGMRYGYGDPAAIKVRGRYYVVATSNNAADAGPIVRSRDLAAWEPAGFLFPAGKRPAWHDRDPERYDFWAPEIHRVGGRYVAYYTARDRTGELRIGAAWAKSVTGPWTDLGRPLIEDARVGLIDAHFFHDKKSGKRYVIWKKDGNQPHVREKTTVYIREVAADGVTFVGERREILENDQPWEHDLVEGLWMLERDGWYYLLYSGNNYTTDKYAMGVARSRSPLGPFEKSPERLLSTGALFHGPGHCSVVKGSRGEDLLVYHAYRPGQAGYRRDRLMRVERMRWVGGWPRVGTGFAGGAPPAGF